MQANGTDAEILHMCTETDVTYLTRMRGFYRSLNKYNNASLQPKRVDMFCQ